MPTILSTEAGATGRYISLGSVAALDNKIKTVIVYCKPTAAGGGGEGYLFGKTTSGNPDGLRLYVLDNAGSPMAAAGDTSSGGLGSPNLAGVANSTPYGTWCHIAFTTTLGFMAADLGLFVDGVDKRGVGENGGTLRANDAANDVFLMNRADSGTLGREFVGDVAYWAFYDAVLTGPQITNATTNGPLSESTNLICVVANDQVYNGPKDAGNTVVIAGRSTRVTGSTPPNTALGSLPTALAFTGTPSAQTGTTGTAFSWAGSALSTFYSGGTAPYTYSVFSGTLPAGLSINSSTGVISGTPSAAGSASIVVRVTDAVAGVINSSAIGFTIAAAAATATTLTAGSSGGTVNTPSALFIVGANGVITGTLTITPSDNGVGGIFAATIGGGTSVTISAATPTATFTYTPLTAGAKTISISGGGLTAPSSLTYTASTVSATLTLLDIANGTNTPLAGATLPNVVVINRATRAFILGLADQVLSAGADLVITSGVLVAGTAYIVLAYSADGTSTGAWSATAV